MSRVPIGCARLSRVLSKDAGLFRVLNGETVLSRVPS